MIEELLFGGLKLFVENTQESLHTLKDSRATLRLLGTLLLQTKGSLIDHKWLTDPV